MDRPSVRGSCPTPSCYEACEEAEADEAELTDWQNEMIMAKVDMLKKRLMKYRAKHAHPVNKNDPQRVKHRKQATKTQKTPVFLELFAGEGMLTKVVGQYAATCVPQDIYDGGDNYVGGKMDLLIPENQKRLRTMVRKQEVRWLHCAPPCKTFSRARRSDRWGSAKILRSTEQPMGFDMWDRQVTEANTIAKFTARLCRTQLRAGGWFSVENPETSILWDTPCMKALRALPEVSLRCGDQCKLGASWRKPTGWLTNAPFLEVVEQRHDDKCEYHEKLEGKVYKDGEWVWKTTLAAEYPKALCLTLAKAYRQGPCEPRRAQGHLRRLGSVQSARHRGQEAARGTKKIVGYKELGPKLREVLGKHVDLHDDIFNKLEPTAGTEMCEGILAKVVEQARQDLLKKLAAQTTQVTGLQGHVFEAVLKEAGDPETEVPKWLQTFTPLGIKCPIIPTGVFPEIEEKGVGPALKDLMDLVAGWHTQQKFSKESDTDGNYSSYVENQIDAENELQKEYANGYFAWYPSVAEAEHVHGKVTISKVGAVVTTKNGKKKVRLIHDLRRSLVNTEVVIKERLVLPRLSDLIDDTTDMMLKARDHESIELVVLDFADAFKQLHVSPLEQPYLAGKAWNGVFVYLVVLFGIVSGPLVWGRVAAVVLRMTQSLLADFGQSECFVDDTVLALRSCASTRRRSLLMVLLFWQVLGLKLGENLNVEE